MMKIKTLIAIYLAIVLAGCVSTPRHGKEVSSDSVNKEAERNQVSAKSSQIANNESVSGVWYGYYECAQGSTFLELSINDSGVRNTVEAIFDFNFNNSELGRYSMTGVYSETERRLKLTPKQWIKQPIGYGMVGLSGVIDTKAQVYSGTVSDRKCGSFILTKDPSEMLSLANKLRSGEHAYISNHLEKKAKSSASVVNKDNSTQENTTPTAISRHAPSSLNDRGARVFNKSDEQNKNAGYWLALVNDNIYITLDQNSS